MPPRAPWGTLPRPARWRPSSPPGGRAPATFSFTQGEGRVDAAGREGLPHRGERAPALLVERAAPAEPVVVLGHLLQPVPRHAAAAGDVLQERDHVVPALGAAEGYEQESVIRRHAPSIARGGLC